MKLSAILIVLFIFAGLLPGCASKEKAQLRATIDSLNEEVQKTQESNRILTEIGMLLDSIDDSRNLIDANMLGNESYDVYVVRLRNIHRYVKEMEIKVTQMEKSLQRARAGSADAALPGNRDMPEESLVIYTPDPYRGQETIIRKPAARRIRSPGEGSR